MNSKIIAAAALATSAAALQLQTKESSGALAYDGCHGTYAYQCIEAKVDTAVQHMIDEVQAAKDACVGFADGARGDILASVQALRASLEASLAAARAAAEARLQAKLDSSSAAISGAAAAAAQAIWDERADTEYRITTERTRVQGELKKLYYESGSDGYHDQYAIKDQMQAMVDAFSAFMDAQGNDFDAFCAAQEAGVEAVIAHETACLNTDISNELAAWNAAAAQAAADLDAAIA